MTARTPGPPWPPPYPRAGHEGREDPGGWRAVVHWTWLPVLVVLSAALLVASWYAFLYAVNPAG